MRGVLVSILLLQYALPCSSFSYSSIAPARALGSPALGLHRPSVFALPRGRALTHFCALAASVRGGTETIDSVETRIRLLWELEDAVGMREFTKAQELQSELRRVLQLADDALLPIGKDVFKGKLVLVTGANGRLGAQVVRELLRRGCSVRATIRSSDEVRDYERLSYEIGAEEGIGDIEAPWIRKSVEMTGTAQMASYGLARLSIVECQLMDEKAVAGAMRDVDSVIWCATDYDGGRPRFEAPEFFTADSLFNVMDGIFLRGRRERDTARSESVDRRIEGSVDVEGVAMGARLMKQEARRTSLVGKGPSALRKAGDPIALPLFMLVSARDDALPLDRFPSGSVQGLKRKGEEELFRVGPERSVVMRFSSFAFDDPRYPAEYPSTPTPANPMFATTPPTSGKSWGGVPPKEEEEEVYIPPPPPAVASSYTLASSPVTEEGEGGGKVARGLAARVIVLAAVAVGGEGGGVGADGRFLTLLA